MKILENRGLYSCFDLTKLEMDTIQDALWLYQTRGLSHSSTAMKLWNEITESKTTNKAFKLEKQLVDEKS